MLLWYLHGVLEGAEVPHLSTKDKVTQLCIREKDDEEHDCETTDVFGALETKERERGRGKNVTAQFTHHANLRQVSLQSINNK